MEFIALEESDLQLVLDYLKKSAEWLKSKDIDYWQNWHNPQKLYVDWIKEGLQSRQFYQVKQDSKPVGIFRLQYEDEMFWGKKNDRAGYIHSFTVNRDYSGKGWGYKILLEVEKLLKDDNRNLLRLDCGEDVAGLIKYYKNYGFNEVGNAEVGGEHLVLLEKKIN